ncbi:hypothetical protein JCM19046_1283 [Bacillus sp. JCM 19046]|nr:hypothetical protein JCM19045_1992 [Bacillus sp. JCM 19045]GAF16821.1 hypothetical protein JCM19046_1283 [Bacillus sp. JCM 19046]
MRVIKVGLVALFVLTGCSTDGMDANSIHQKHDYGMGAFGPGPLNFEHMQGETFEPGQTNLGTSYINPSVPHRTLEEDARQVEGIVTKQGFRSGTAFVNGGHIYVKAHPNEHWSKKETEQHLIDLNRAFKSEIPRYRVHVR